MKKLKSLIHRICIYRKAGVSFGESVKIALIKKKYARNRARIRALQKRCQKCGSDKNLTIDHIVPLKAGGAKNGLKNLQVLCYPCNFEKDNFPRKCKNV